MNIPKYFAVRSNIADEQQQFFIYWFNKQYGKDYSGDSSTRDYYFFAEKGASCDSGVPSECVIYNSPSDFMKILNNKDLEYEIY